MRKTAFLLLSILLSGCAPLKTMKIPSAQKKCPPCPAEAPLPEKEAFFEKLEGEKIPEFKIKQDKAALLRAVRLNIEYLENIANKELFYQIGGRKVNAAALLRTSRLFKKTLESGRKDVNSEIRKNFDIYRVSPPGGEKVVFSSYYEPVLDASLEKTVEYRYPVYSMPSDMIEADLEKFNPKFKGEKIYGRVSGNQLKLYYGREEIDYKNALEGKVKPLAWFKNRVDAMNLHIQGSGRLRAPDGRHFRVGFAATNGLPFKGWISYLIEKGYMERKGITYEKAKEFLLSHPEIEREVLTSNKRYTFFKLEEIKNPADGPRGTFKLPLTAKASIAVDESLIPLGTLSYVRFKMPVVENGKFSGMKDGERFALCQDTGGAIKGPGRVDFFAGTGEEANVFANKVWEEGEHYLLIAKENGASPVLTGLDIIKKNGFKELKGKKTGLITNHSALNREGKTALEVFYASGIDLAAIFSPEHGLKGLEEGGEMIKDSKHGDKKIPVFSLYGKTRRPVKKMIEGLDALVFDIQDIGARFYTYLTTMGYAMEEAAKEGIEFIVLDRPNPIGGEITEGPVLENGIRAFTAYYPVPVRHGFTAGEMALFHKENKNLDLKLEIVKMEGWKRDMFFRETGLKWVNPSPNIRNPESEILYPGIGCFEATNISVGRGTEEPFLWFGAPWMKAGKIAEKLNESVSGPVEFGYEERTPSENMYAGELCRGVRMKIKKPEKVKPLEIFLNAVYLLKKYNGKDFKIRPAELARMLGDSKIADLLIKGEKPEKIIREITKSNAGFSGERKKYFLYQ